ncbi:hypothetical protein K469DRAFT_687694 [Zopfia rhizophila CBS 207.26]|uniref:Uncharacterized protein n=1 Tax=Zopfia rhizophila CBS 207.26 TaxID=1314779 RepID=A0A6A6E7N6_9PEZI|nr:hypothetical protein K469DRAFT_687694 [Zopfia rhizophila CBS 207.26]
MPQKPYIAWWERPGALAPSQNHSSAPPPKPKKPPKGKSTRRRGSSVMSSIIRSQRFSRRITEHIKQKTEMSSNTEAAIRRKHGLPNDFKFIPGTFDAPCPVMSLLSHHQLMNEMKLYEERRRRFNQPKSRPGRSSLRNSEAANEISEVECETAKMKREVERIEMVGWEAERVGKEVGYLYFVGLEWEGLWEEFARSDHDLVWREKERL